jgi:hypothetical protein
MRRVRCPSGIRQTLTRAHDAKFVQGDIAAMAETRHRRGRQSPRCLRQRRHRDRRQGRGRVLSDRPTAST